MRKFELHSAISLCDASEAQRKAVSYIEILSTLRYPHFVHLTNKFDSAEHQYSLSSVIGEPESEVLEALSHPDVDWFKAPHWRTWMKIVRKANKSEMIRQNQTWVSYYGSNPPSVATSYPQLHADMTPPDVFSPHLRRTGEARKRRRSEYNGGSNDDNGNSSSPPPPPDETTRERRSSRTRRPNSNMDDFVNLDQTEENQRRGRQRRQEGQQQRGGRRQQRAGGEEQQGGEQQQQQQQPTEERTQTATANIVVKDVGVAVRVKLFGTWHLATVIFLEQNLVVVYTHRVVGGTNIHTVDQKILQQIKKGDRNDTPISLNELRIPNVMDMVNGQTSPHYNSLGEHPSIKICQHRLYTYVDNLVMSTCPICKQRRISEQVPGTNFQGHTCRL